MYQNVYEDVAAFEIRMFFFFHAYFIIQMSTP